MAPAATSTLAVSCGMAPALTATDVTATMMGSAVVQYSAMVRRLCVDMSRVSLPVESAAKMGTARMSSKSAMKPSSTSGCWNTAARSIFAPDTTKKIGMRKPYATPSSLCSSAWSPSGMM